MITEDILEQNEAALEAIRPTTPVYKRCFDWLTPSGERKRIEYVQEQLGYFPSQELLTMLTRVMKDITDGKYGINVGELFSQRKELQSAIPADFDEDKINDAIKNYLPIIQGFLHLLEVVPGLQEDVIAISLGVSRDRATRGWFKEQIAAPPRLGGLSMEDGVEIMKAAIEQNGGLLKRFLAEQVQELAEAFMEAVGMGRTEGVVDSTAAANEMDNLHPSDGGRQPNISVPGTPASV